MESGQTKGRTAFRRSDGRARPQRPAHFGLGRRTGPEDRGARRRHTSTWHTGQAARALPEDAAGDDLITPVYVPPTRPPAVSKNVTRPGGKICENDDEDCLEGSGLPATEDPLTTAKDLLTTLSGTTRAVDDLNVTEDSLSNATSNRIIIISSETTGRPAVSFVPIVVPGSSGPGDGSSSSLPPSGIGGGTPYGGHTTPVDVSSGSSSTSEATKTPTTPSTTTTTEAFPLPPAPPPSPPVQPPFFPAYPPGIGRDRSRDRISSAAAENTALIIVKCSIFECQVVPIYSGKDGISDVLRSTEQACSPATPKKSPQIVTRQQILNENISREYGTGSFGCGRIRQTRGDNIAAERSTIGLILVVFPFDSIPTYSFLILPPDLFADLAKRANSKLSVPVKAIAVNQMSQTNRKIEE
ncbi:unnamed protein product [Nesidiocoris tenuis]|uniref:Uncharacterized protein n=1 Tax=Nesidiocoris tenuis TaxID=355587 RepID=A0A6H5H6U8_9HEMI|nr:unnamed protein product [Nesidiocoris tenuis]